MTCTGSGILHPPAPAGLDDEEIGERARQVANDCAARLGEHYESVVIITLRKTSAGNFTRGTVIDGNDYAAYAAAKAYVLAEEKKMRVNEM